MKKDTNDLENKIIKDYMLNNMTQEECIELYLKKKTTSQVLWTITITCLLIILFLSLALKGVV